MVKYGRFVDRGMETTPEAVQLFDNIVEAVGVNEKVEIFKVTLESLGEYAGKFEVLKVEKRSRRKKRTSKTVATEVKSKRKYTKRSKFWKK